MNAEETHKHMLHHSPSLKPQPQPKTQTQTQKSLDERPKSQKYEIEERDETI